MICSRSLFEFISPSQSHLDIRTVEVPPTMAGKLYMLVMFLISVLCGLVDCGTHLDKPWFKWTEGRVPYYFNVSLSSQCPGDCNL